MRKKLKITLTLVFFIFLAFFGVYRLWFGGGKLVPFQFAEARLAGAQVADKIASLSSLSLGNLEVINRYDREKNYQAALGLVKVELARNQEARLEAVKLSNYLDQMVRVIAEIKPRPAQRIATRAVGQEINLINHLIQRYELLQQLFGLLEVKFENGSAKLLDQVPALIKKVNEESIAINRLNKQFNDSMAEFDALTLLSD